MSKVLKSSKVVKSKVLKSKAPKSSKLKTKQSKVLKSKSSKLSSSKVSKPKEPKVEKPKVSKVAETKVEKPQPAKPYDLSVFYEDFIPPRMVVRDKQIEQIKQAIDNFIKDGVASNLQLQGVTGSGKTSTLMYVIKDYDPNLFAIVKGKQVKGVKEVLAQIAGLKPLARQRAPDLMPDAIKALKQKRRIIVIDDVTAIPSWLDLLGYLDGIYRAVQTPIFVTTNSFKFLEKLPDDVRHTLLFFRVDFPAYNAQDLYQIIKDRVELAGVSIPDETLKLISAYSAQVGSARDALTMTRTAIQLGKTNPEGIQELQRIMEEQTFLDYISKLAPKERQVFSYLLQRYVHERKPIPVRDISKDLHLSPSRTSQLVTGLEQYEVIQTRTEKGREGGNFRVIELDESLVEKAQKGEIDINSI